MVVATEVCLLVAISREELWVHTVYMFCLNENRFQIYLNTSRDQPELETAHFVDCIAKNCVISSLWGWLVSWSVS